jgi:hypothetical protein
MLPKKGKTLHRNQKDSGDFAPFERAIAAALKEELGRTHQAVKTVMNWTGASERTVKHWLAGTHGPSGEYLVALARHSDSVLQYFLLAANRPIAIPGMQLMSIRARLVDIVDAIDACGPRPRE